MITFSIQNQPFGDKTLWDLLDADRSALKVMIMAYKNFLGTYEQKTYQYNENDIIKEVDINKNENNIEVSVNFSQDDFTLTEVDSWYSTYVIIYSKETVLTGLYYKIENDNFIETTDEQPIALLQKWINIDSGKVYNDLTDEHKYFYIGKDRVIYSEIDDNKGDNIILTKDNDAEEITWKIPRYYDGIDLATKNISIYYIRPVQLEAEEPQGLTESLIIEKVEDEYITATWVVTDLATNIAGTLTYSIVAEGDGLKDEYFWQSKISTFIVEKGIYGNLPSKERSFKFIDTNNFRTDVYKTIEELQTIHENGEVKWQSIASLMNPLQEV